MSIEAKGLAKDFEFRKPGAGSGPLGWFSRERSRVQAVQGIDLSIARGEALAFIGPNGAGKSTTIKMLTGILHPTGGEARVLGLVPWRDRKRLAMRIGSVFGQKSQLWLHLPPADAFRLLSRIYELDRGRYEARKRELVSLFEIGDLIHTPTRKLSLGQRMRCEIAACLLHEPEILFLDEPTIGLDPVAKAAIRDLIRKINREQGVTVFLTSHDSGDIEHLCKRVIIINQGKLVLDGSVAALRRDYLNTKEIDLKLGVSIEDASGLEAPGVRVVKVKGSGAKLSVDTKKTPIDVAISSILKKYPVEDITIQDPPMEDIIAAIYRGRGKDASA